jgi:beta-1,4-mannosyl-glycoprotein beta-1,4-N-acetylglucosaminyltransferase
MKLVDCFMYFDEDLILDIRLNTLNEYVDKFVISEATRDHAGNDKKLNFDIKKFSKFKNKIIYIVEENLPKSVPKFKKNWSSNHHRDNLQRNSLEKGYCHFHDEDLIMISDTDEIPNPKTISSFNKKNTYGCFIQKNLSIKLNLLNTTNSLWPGTKICVKKFLKSPQWLRNIKTKDYPFWKFYKPKTPQLINDGGWHFSFLKKPKDIAKKIKSYAHQELNKEEFTDINLINNRVELGRDIFDRDFNYKKIELNSDFPKYILENKLKFKDWIL